MPEPDNIRAYLETAGEQIRWERARRVVIPELRQHLEDQRDAFAAEGREEAERLAVEEMGDPVSVGAELDRIHRPKPQWGLLALTAMFALTGTVLRVWLTADWADTYQNLDPLRAGLAFMLGCGALLAGYFLDISCLGHYAAKIYVGFLVFTLLMWRFSPQVGGVPFYARYVVLCAPVVYADWLYTCRSKGWRGLVMAILGGLPLALFCCWIPYMLALVSLMAVGFVLVLMACWKNWFGVGRRKSLTFFGVCVAGIIGTAAYWYLRSGHAFRRLSTALHPERDPLGMGWYGLNIRRSLEVSQWWGQGSWEYTYPYESVMPLCNSDNLLTTLIYRLGWLPFLLLMLIFAGLVGCLLVRCLRQRSQLGQFLVVTVVVMLSVPALLSVAWNLGFTWNGGLFPLLMGNVTTVLYMGLIGLALSAFRGDNIVRDQVCNTGYHPRYRIKISIQKL